MIQIEGRIDMDSLAPLSLAPLSEIIFTDKVVTVYWDRVLRCILLGYSEGLYTFSMRGFKNDEITMRHVLKGVGVRDYMILEVLMDASKAHDFTADEVLDSDCWNTVPHQIRIRQKM